MSLGCVCDLQNLLTLTDENSQIKFRCFALCINAHSISLYRKWSLWFALTVEDIIKLSKLLLSYTSMFRFWHDRGINLLIKLKFKRISLFSRMLNFFFDRLQSVYLILTRDHRSIWMWEGLLIVMVNTQRNIKWLCSSHAFFLSVARS